MIIFLDRPTGLTILSVAIALVVLLAVIEFLNQAAPATAPSPTPAVIGPAPPGAMP